MIYMSAVNNSPFLPCYVREGLRGEHIWNDSPFWCTVSENHTKTWLPLKSHRLPQD
jgi:hypothetical protein